MRLTSTLFFVLFIPGLAAGVSSPLAGHSSPYLAMHADDPVQWHLWNDEVLQQAQRENRLIFISSGYFACHWCHVMQRESFRNETIAALLNRIAIPVKVDRELNPELDAALRTFVERSRGVAGWPLNVFLTPQGYPLVGTVYLPPEDFLEFVERLDERWQREGEMLAQLAQRAVLQGAKRLPQERKLTVSALRERLRQGLSLAIQQQGDFLAGGLGDGAKYPQAPLMDALLQQAGRDESLKAFVTLTLEKMAGKGLRDHLGGGFFRYTVDPAWMQPHFEKMLYDNAQLARLYLHAAKALELPAYRRLALQTLDFMIREMWHRDGGFIAGLSADDQAGVEGGYYLWTHARLQAVLDEQHYRLLNVAWSFYAAPQWQAGLLPLPALAPKQVAEQLSMPVAQVEKSLRDARRALLQARDMRRLPRDEQRLAGWNGLALSALSEANEAGTKYRQAGRVVRDYLHSLWDGRKLWRLRTERVAGGVPGSLEDYVYVAQGLLDWAEVSADQQSRELAALLVEEAWQRFSDRRGWYRGEGEAVRRLSPPSPMLADGALPSPSALWLRLKHRLGEQVPRDLVLQADPQVLLAKPLHYPSYLIELERLADKGNQLARWVAR